MGLRSQVSKSEVCPTCRGLALYLRFGIPPLMRQVRARRDQVRSWAASTKMRLQPLLSFLPIASRDVASAVEIPKVLSRILRRASQSSASMCPVQFEDLSLPKISQTQSPRYSHRIKL